MTTQPNHAQLPADLPAPRDDGATAHLFGMAMPDVTLPSTLGGLVNIGALPRRTVMYAYPMTGVPGVTLPDG